MRRQVEILHELGGHLDEPWRELHKGTVEIVEGELRMVQTFAARCVQVLGILVETPRSEGGLTLAREALRIFAEEPGLGADVGPVTERTG